MSGRVSSFRWTWGFIAPDGGGEHVFVHFTAIEGAGFRTLQANQRVEFVIGLGRRGPKAIRVRSAAKRRDDRVLPSAARHLRVAGE